MPVDPNTGKVDFSGYTSQVRSRPDYSPRDSEGVYTSGSEALLMEAVVRTLFPQYLTGEASVTAESPRGIGVRGSYNTESKEIKVQSPGGDIQYPKGSKAEKFSGTSFNQLDFVRNLETMLHELAHARYGDNPQITSNEDPKNVVKGNRYELPALREREKRQQVMKLAQEAGVPSMAPNMFGGRDSEEFMASAQVLRDIVAAGFKLPQDSQRRYEFIRNAGIEDPKLRNWIEANNFPNSPTLKESPRTLLDTLKQLTRIRSNKRGTD